MDGADVDAYLGRIGARRPALADLESLVLLQDRHLRSVPFENLSIHLGERIELTERALVRKIVERRRGGFCYELNGAFAELLSALGFEVTLLAARVMVDSELGPPFDHLALRVELSEPWLVDVGFGRFARRPIRWDVRTEQTDLNGVFLLKDGQQGDLDVVMNGRPVYRLERRPRALADFEATCWWHQTSPRSHFTTSLICSLPTETGRITLSGRQFIRTEGDDRQERTIGTDAELLAAYRDYFGVVLDRLPELRPRIQLMTGANASMYGSNTVT